MRPATAPAEIKGQKPRQFTKKKDRIPVAQFYGNTNTNQLKSGVIDEFVAAIMEQRKPIVTGFDGHQALAVVIAAGESSKKGQWVDIQY